MKIVLDVPDSKVGLIMELLGSLSFVKTKPLPVGISAKKALFSIELGGAVGELNDMLADKTSTSNAYDLLNEL